MDVGPKGVAVPGCECSHLNDLAVIDWYERLLEIGREAGRAWRFAEPMDSSLQFTVTDLARERPGIRVSELASLLNLDPAMANNLARRAVETEEVSITF